MQQHFSIYIDEAGRGPLAGPLYVGLILPYKTLTRLEVSIFEDSKKLSQQQRETCFAHIQSLQQQKKLIALSAFATATEIDTYGITNALNLAITRGLALMTRKVMKGKLQIPSSYSAFRDTLLQLSTTQQIHFHLVIDGNRDFRLKNTFPTLDIMTIIKGDAKIKEIAMASIVAKVSRDNVMSSLPSKYHNYAFAQHKGYGTAFHRAIIAKFGVSDIHRKLFLKQLFPQHCFQKQLPENF